MNPQVFGTALRRTLMLAVLSGLAAPAAGEEWTSLFDGKTLGKWNAVDEADFGATMDPSGSRRAGFCWRKETPRPGWALDGRVPQDELRTLPGGDAR